MANKFHAKPDYRPRGDKKDPPKAKGGKKC